MEMQLHTLLKNTYLRVYAQIYFFWIEHELKFGAHWCQVLTEWEITVWFLYLDKDE